MTKMVSNPNRMPEKTELVLFKDGEINLEVPVIPEEETVWLNQAQMVEPHKERLRGGRTGERKQFAFFANCKFGSPGSFL